MKLTDFKTYNDFVLKAGDGYESLKEEIKNLVIKNDKLRSDLLLLGGGYPDRLYRAMLLYAKTILDKYFSRENEKYEMTITLQNNETKDIYSYDLIPLVQFIKPVRVFEGTLFKLSLDELYEFLYKFVGSRHIASKANELYLLQLNNAEEKLKNAVSKQAKEKLKNSVSDLEIICSVMQEYLKDTEKPFNEKGLAFKIIPLLEDYRLYHSYILKNNADKKNEIDEIKNKLNLIIKKLSKLCGVSEEKINEFLNNAEINISNMISKPQLHLIFQNSIDENELKYLYSISEFVQLVKGICKQNENKNTLTALCNEFLLQRFYNFNSQLKNE